MTGVVLGQVAAPSGVIVLACGGFLQEWPSLGEALSVRAERAAAAGGGHLRDWLAEAVAVPAGASSLKVVAHTRPGAYEPAPAIAELDVHLARPWTGPAELGDLPVDETGMVIGDARVLDSWIGFLHGSPAVDGLADIRLWGKGEEQAWKQFDAPPIPGLRCHGWLDLPVEEARARAAEVNEWATAEGHHVYMATVDVHSHHHLGWRAGWEHPLGAGEIEVAGCPVVCVAWSPVELQRFRGGRAYGHAHPVSLVDVDGEAVLRWVIPPMAG